MPHVTDGDYSLSFDGSDDYVDIPNSNSLEFGAGSITYSVWFKKSTSSHSQPSNLITNYKTTTTPYFSLMLFGTAYQPGKINVAVRNTSSVEAGLESSTRLDDNQWHHAVAIKDAGS